MIGADTARTALEPMWIALVELAEAGHELVVNSQASSSAPDAERITSLARDLGDLAQAAAVLARHAEARP